MLKIEGIGYSFGFRRLFSDVSLRVGPGELVHIRGANGAGKSTLLELLAGIKPLQEGEVLFSETGSQKLLALKEVCAYLPAEANGLYMKMDAIDNLLFWSKLRGLDLDRAQLLQEMGRWGLGHRLLARNFPVQQFSTGMRRRLALLRLSLSQASCWLLDEPIYGLDEKGIELFARSLKEHCSSGGSALLVSHDRLAFADMVAKDYFLSSP